MTGLKKVSRTIDIIFCVVVLPLLLSIIPMERMFANSRIFTILLVGFLYSVYLIIRSVNFPRLIWKKKYIRAALIMVLLFTVTSLLAHFPLTDALIMNLPEGEFPRVTAQRTQRVWFLFLVVSGFSLAIDLTCELFRQIIARKELEYARDKAELSLYKAQINPHFLFNSLNTIYGMIVAGSDKTEDAFVSFTDMLKYMYEYPDADKISVSREMEYVGNYIDFQSLRYGETTQVKWNYEIDDPSLEMPPMILVTFIENAFKYGASSSAECAIEASADVRDGRLHFEVSNMIVNRGQDEKVGIGIENCRSRLNLLCPGKYSLVTTEDDGRFDVKFDLDLS